MKNEIKKGIADLKKYKYKQATKTVTIAPLPKQKEAAAKVDYKEHWKGMPEFNQPGIKPVKSLIVHFANKEDMLKFSKFVGHQITAKTKSIWYPVQSNEPRWDKRWSDKKVKQ